jgi:protein tyrosine phosphatase
MLGQMVLRSRMGSKLFDYADLMPFGETAVTIDKWHESDKEFINASYIKSSFGEDHPTEEDEPFGLMIATSGPHKNVEEFWKMIIQ